MKKRVLAFFIAVSMIVGTMVSVGATENDFTTMDVTSLQEVTLMSTDLNTITTEELFHDYPTYLINGTIDHQDYLASQACINIINSYDKNDISVACWMTSLSEGGLSLALRNILGSVGIGDTLYESYTKDVAKKFVKNLLSTEEWTAIWANEMKDTFKELKMAYEVNDVINKDTLYFRLAEKCSNNDYHKINISKESLKKLINETYTNKTIKNTISTSGKAIDLWKYITEALELHSLETSSIDFLVAELEKANMTNSDLYIGLVLLKEDIEKDEAAYIITKYFNADIVKFLSKNIQDIMLGVVNIEKGNWIALTINTACKLYSDFFYKDAKADKIVKAEISYSFASILDCCVMDYQCKFMQNNFNATDIENYEKIYNAYFAARITELQMCYAMCKEKDKETLGANCLKCETNYGQYCTYDKYIASCKDNVTKGIPDGVYSIVSALNDESSALDIEGQSHENKANVHLWSRHSGDSQKFRIIKNGNSYTIKNVNSNKALDVDGGSNTNGTNVFQYDAQNSTNQQWYFEYAQDGYYYIRSGVGAYLDVSGGNSGDGTNIQVWEKNSSISQKFKFVQVHEHLYEIVGNDTAHPHRQYKKCTCGSKIYTGKTTYSTHCRTCNPPNPVSIEWNGHSYTAYFEKTTWGTAKAKCEELGGHLATITSDEEQSLIQEIVSEIDVPCWIGAYRNSGENSYRWITGESFSYTNWDTDEPSFKNGSNNELYVGIYANDFDTKYSTTGKWNDFALNTGTIMGYVCEWEPRTYTINFDANGGETSVSSKSVINGENYGELPEPAREGYTFYGWCTSINGNVSVTSETIVNLTSDQTLYARWGKNRWVYMHPNGGDGIEEATCLSFSGEFVEIPTSCYTRTGYTMIGWSTSPVATEPEYSVEDSTYIYFLYDDIIQSISLYAVWKPNEYTITYVANGGYDAPLSQQKKHDADTTLTYDVPTNPGYNFVGWSLTSDGEIAYRSGDKYENNSNVTLFAQWEERQYSVEWSYDKDILTISGKEMYNYGGEHSPWFYLLKNKTATVIIQDGVTSIGASAFYGSLALESVILPESITSIYDSAFSRSASLGSIIIPSNVMTISSNAFKNCKLLETIELPQKLKKIGDDAFSGTTITDVYYAGTEEEWNNIFIGTGNEMLQKATIHFSAKMPQSGVFGDGLTWSFESGTLTISGKGAMDSTQPWRAFLGLINNVVIGDGVTSIGDYAMFGCTNLTKVEIPQSVVNIGNSAFYWCVNLESIDIPNGVRSIGDYAFHNCYSLKKIEFPQGMTDINVWLFSHCTNLTEVKIPQSITNIYTSAFDSCNNLVDIYYSGTLSEWNSIKFENNILGDGKFVMEHANIHTIPCPVESVLLDTTTAQLNIDDSIMLTATIFPNKADNQNVLWTSSNETVATVEKGVVLARSAGNTTITVTTEDGNNTATCEVEVLPKIYNITYNTNGGVNQPNKQYKTENIDLTLSDIQPQREGYVFKGWSTKPNGTVKYVSNEIYTDNDNAVLYAVWEKTHISLSGTCNAFTINLYGDTSKGTVFAALYSSNRTLKSVNMYSGQESVFVEFPNVDDTDYVKTMWWLDNLSPLCEVQTLGFYESSDESQDNLEYIYDILYVSSNGTILGTDTISHTYGSTYTVYPTKEFEGYTTPQPQDISWDSTISKTITFIYDPKSVDSSMIVGSEAFLSSNGVEFGWIELFVESQNRTATSVQVRIGCKESLKSNYYNGFPNYFSGSFNGLNTETIQALKTNEWGTSSSISRTKTIYSDWITVPVSAQATYITVSARFWEELGLGSYDKIFTKKFVIPSC